MREGPTPVRAAPRTGRRDPPRHTVLRTVLGAAFSGRAVERIRPRIQQLVDGILDRAEELGAMDVIRDLASPLPATVIAELLGVPTNDLDLFKRWSDDLADSFTWAPDSMRPRSPDVVNGLCRGSRRSSTTFHN